MAGNEIDYGIQFVREIITLSQQLENASRLDDALLYRLEHLYRRILDVTELENAAFPLARAAEMLREYFQQQQQNDDSRRSSSTRGRPTTTTTGNPGRPKFEISRRQLKFFIDNGFTMKEVAGLLCVSLRTVKYRLNEYGLKVSQKFTDIEDVDLDSKVLHFLQNFPNAGYKSVHGHLTSEGINVQRCRVREAMLRVDPEGRQLNALRRCIRRRSYSVHSPMTLWHIDGNHKLIRWRIVIHGGIDGYSRLIVYLHSSNNNLSETVLTVFKEAVDKWGLPLRVRADKGVENRGVASYMLSHPSRGPDQGAFITGRSVHNSRIERLWRDVHEAVVCQYQDLFYHLEETGYLKPDDEMALYALHLVYLPRINKRLNQFVRMWNNHKIRTAGNKSPLDLFLRGMNAIAGEEGVITHEYFHEQSNYGFDPDAPIPMEEVDEGVIVPAIQVNFGPGVVENIDLPSEEQDRFGIESYKVVLRHLSESQNQNVN